MLNVSAAARTHAPYTGTDWLQTQTEDDLVLGIDLGTSNSSACCIVNGQPVIIDLREPGDTRVGVRSMPSVVAFDDASNSIVGEQALAQRALNNKRVVSGVKRFIGRQYDSPIVQAMIAHSPNRIVPAPGGSVGVEINGRVKSLSAISAYILKAIHTRAEAQLNRPIHKVIITVPAYYNDNQRDAVVQAGRLAGLDVVRILNEPTAAAVAYGLGRAEQGTFLVYDLGGGTFDVSVMRLEKNGLKVLATAGDTFLGGEDFDTAIVNEVCERYRVKNGGATLSRNGAGQALLKSAVEQAKRRLSLREETPLHVREVTRTDRGVVRLEMTLTRKEIEKVVAPLVKRTLDICEQAMRDARVAPKELGEVIMVGGQTQMPFVLQSVREHFGREPRTELNPDETVALGAGLFPRMAKQRASFTDVLPMAIGVGVRGKFQPVIAKNTALPHRRETTFSVTHAQIKDFRLDILQGDHEDARKNERLGVLTLDGLRPGRLDPMPLSVSFSVTGDCLLNLQLTNSETGESHSVLLRAREAL